MSDILEVCANLPQVTYDAGETVLAEGGDEQKLFVLVEGTVEILKEDLQINVVSQPGSVFGEISALLNTPHMATVKALEPSRLCMVEDSKGFLESHPDLSFSVACLVATRLQQVTSYLADLKRQFEDQEDHMGIVDEVLESLLNAQACDQEVKPGSDREYEPNL